MFEAEADGLAELSPDTRIYLHRYGSGSFLSWRLFGTLEERLLNARFLFNNMGVLSGDTIYTVPNTAQAFRIGWGEGGGQAEGWYPWWAGRVYLR